ncbi:MAG: protein-methionine-sulfoxide reductase catalytic subunit MsrP [Pseudomonadota bacterium]
MFVDRRRVLQAMGLGAIATALPAGSRSAQADAITYPFPKNEKYTIDRPVTAEELNINYNNFYEFGSTKTIAKTAQRLTTKPWTVTFDGLVEKPITIDAEALLAQMPREDRVYRHRCVEGWSMTVPWSGFPLAEMVKFAKPLGAAKYVRMETFSRPEEAPGLRQFWYPWPYIEGVTMAEAMNELGFMVTGAYGKPLNKSMGAPLRLHLPWKYGFKSIKSIIKVSFVEARPVSFWEKLQASEYGFWANVNPEVPHPRWSQATERVLGSDDRVPTKLFNGYAEYVADLYKDLQTEKLWA